MKHISPHALSNQPETERQNKTKLRSMSGIMQLARLEFVLGKCK